MPSSRAKVLKLSHLENLCGEGLVLQNILKTSVSTHVDDCLIACKSKDIMAAFKKELLTRFVGTDEGEVIEYL
jgi:hypothetical protein